MRSVLIGQRLKISRFWILKTRFWNIITNNISNYLGGKSYPETLELTALNPSLLPHTNLPWTNKGKHHRPISECKLEDNRPAPPKSSKPPGRYRSTDNPAAPPCRKRSNSIRHPITQSISGIRMDPISRLRPPAWHWIIIGQHDWDCCGRLLALAVSRGVSCGRLDLGGKFDLVSRWCLWIRSWSIDVDPDDETFREGENDQSKRQTNKHKQTKINNKNKTKTRLPTDILCVSRSV